MSIGEALTPLGLGGRASFGSSADRDRESPRGRRLRPRWRLPRRLLQPEPQHESFGELAASDPSLALTSTPRHSWLRSRPVSRCSVSPILVEEDPEQDSRLEAATCCQAVAVAETDKGQPSELDRFSTTLFAANLEKMELDDRDGINNNLKEDIKQTSQEKCESSTQEGMKRPIKKTKKKVRSKKSPHKSPNYKVDSRKFSNGASRKSKSPKDSSVKIWRKKHFNASLSGSSFSSKGTSIGKIKGSRECTSSPIWRRPKSPLLRTAERAKAKQYRQELRRQKEKQIEEMRQRILEEKRRKEEEEFQKLRQQTVFKAAPIRKYAPLPHVKKRPLTEPVSPNIRKRQRTTSSSRSCSSNRTE